MSCDVGEVTECLENELCSLYCIELCSFSKLSVTSPTSQLILQPFRRFTYVTVHSQTLLLLHLRHSSFSNPSFAYPTSQALHLIHLPSRPCRIMCRFGIEHKIIYKGIMQFFFNYTGIQQMKNLNMIKSITVRMSKGTSVFC